MLTQEELKEILNYNSETGIFTWLVNRRANKVKGNIAGTIDKGYVRICVNKKSYRAHRLAFLFKTGKWPKDQIDHINQIKDDNRWCNLREANTSQNMMNRGKTKINASGFKCVSWHKANKRWQSKICINKKGYHLGQFDTKEEASEVYKEAAKKLHGDFYFEKRKK